MMMKFKMILKAIGLMFIGVVLWAYAMFQGGFVSWFLFYSFLPFLLYDVAFRLYSFSTWNVQLDLKKKELLTEEALDITISIKRRIPFPLYFLKVSLFLPQTLNLKKNPVKVVFPFVKKSMEFICSLENLPRGEHTFNKILIHSGDIFQFAEKERSFEVDEKVIVYPKWKAINVKLPSYFHGNDTASSLRKSESSLLVSGVRDYYPGDKLSRIDWRASARSQHLKTKEFEEEQTGQSLIVMDCFVGQNKTDFELVITLTLSLVKMLIDANKNFLFVSTNLNAEKLDLSRNKDMFKKVLFDLAKVKADSNEKIDEWLARQRGQSMNYSKLIITSSITEGLLNSEATKGVCIFLVKSFFSQKDYDAVRKLKQKKIDVFMFNEQLILESDGVNGK